MSAAAPASAFATAASDAVALPVLRPDLALLPGPDDPDGAPTYVLHDPVTNTFDRLTWAQGEIVHRLQRPTTLGALQQSLARETTLKLAAEDVARLCQSVAASGLTRDACVTRTEPPHIADRARRTWTLTTLFRAVTYLRVPLLRPDAFLTHALPYVRPLGSRVAGILYVLCGLCGLLLLAQRFDAYCATFPYFFTAAGVAAFGATIVAIKTVHEFAHAFVAKAYGCRVPTMGLALIFLFPVAYSDVTDSWRLARRGQRLRIALAGVAAELVIAGLALLVWGLSPAGMLHSACFVVSSVTLLSTLLLNLNPCMRYDGYYVLSDSLGIDNLQSRAGAIARWLLRARLLGLPLPTPEPGMAPRRVALLAVYAACAWTYRLFLYMAIALALYHRVTKVLGGLLFVLALYTFLVRPVLGELTAIFRARRLLSWHRRTVAAALTAAAAFAWALWPLPSTQKLVATTAPRATQVLYAPGEGVLRELHVTPHGRVQQSQPLFIVESDELSERARLAELEVQRADLELALTRSEEKYRALLPQKLEELARAQARLASLQAALAANRVTAAADGQVVEWDDSLRDGTPVGPEQVLGRIIADGPPTVLAYAPADLLSGLTVGQRVSFTSDAAPGPQTGVITFIDAVRTSYLEHRGLTSVAGGPIAVVPDTHGRLATLDSYYQIEVTLDTAPPALRTGQTGTIAVRTPPRSRALELVRYLHRVLLRESSF